MRFALSEMGVVRLALCAFGYIVWQGEGFWEGLALPRAGADAYTPARTEPRPTGQPGFRACREWCEFPPVYGWQRSLE